MRAKARHILVADEQACTDLKTQIEGGCGLRSHGL